MDDQGQYVYLCGWGGLSLSWAEIGKGLFQLLLLWSGKFASPTFAAWQLFVELKWTVKRIVLVLDNVVVIVVVAVEAVGRQRRQKIETSRPDDALWIIAVERQVEYVLETVFRYLQKKFKRRIKIRLFIMSTLRGFSNNIRNILEGRGVDRVSHKLYLLFKTLFEMILNKKVLFKSKNRP